VTAEARPFDTGLGSPIAAIQALRADGREAVVALSGPTATQQRLYRAGRTDRALVEIAQSELRPHVVIATGSAGSGKSAAVEYQSIEHPDLYSDIIEDATHSDSPRVDQAETLAERLRPLSNGAARPALPILIAANTGMLLQLFDAWRGGGAFTEFEAAALAPLGLEQDGADPGDLRAVVLNLDDRPTAGPDGLLVEMLPLLDPDDPEGVMAGAPRCDTCTVISWCSARTNAVLASSVAADGIGELAGAAAQERGRHDSPRMVWDWLANIVAPASQYDGFDDPCFAVVAAAERGDEQWRLTGLLPVTIFRAPGDLGSRVTAFEPSRTASKLAYTVMASAGLDRDEDRRRLAALAVPGALAMETAAVRASQLESDEQGTDWRLLLGRAEVGAAFLADRAQWPLDRDGDAAVFARALEMYRDWQLAVADATVAAPDGATDILGEMVHVVGRGLAQLFGVLAEGRDYLPLRSYDARDRSRLHVAVDIDLSTMRPCPDLATELNPVASGLLGHEPLAIRLTMGDAELALDLPTYRLVAAAAHRGLAVASDSDERYHALRRISESLARTAADLQGAVLLAEDPSTGRAHVITQAPSLGSRQMLRTRAVVA
jgi:hypothetical protein